ncbi:transcription antiterminator [Geomicrobium sp. JSM 1781026]|uniref:BglG family transcription antiterminator n=1 Tax=Geomicrobium sp. JSM 1781026 TaxID=3344580 RepID=UPI0035C14E16
MTSRQVAIVLYLFVQNGPVSIQAIAETINCSDKTVRNEWSAIDEYFQSHQLGRVVRKQSKGVYLDQTDEEADRLRELLSSEGAPKQTNRHDELARMLVSTRDSLTVTQLADHFYVSRSVIREDLTGVAVQMQKFGIGLERKPNVGIVITGEEKDRRSFLAELFHRSFQASGQIRDWFSPFDWAAVERVIRSIEKERNWTLTYRARTSIIVHILLSEKRIKQKFFIMMSEHDNCYPDYMNDLIHQLESLFNIRWKSAEKRYLFYHFQSARIELNESSSEHSFLTLTLSDSTLRFTNQLMDDVTERTGYPFRNDQNLFRSLALHLEGSLIRIQQNFRMHNPLVFDVRKQYPYLFEMILQSLERLDLSLNWHHDEVAYLTIHFQVALEHLDDRVEDPVRIAIVCPEGRSMGKLLEAKIKQLNHSVTIVATNSEPEYIRSAEVDLIVSTVPINSAEKPVIVVSPFLKAHEHDLLIQAIVNTQKPEVSALKTLLGSADNIHFLSSTHRFQVIEDLVQPLIDTDRVNTVYMESTFAREQRSSTYIGGGIAIPHGSPDHVFTPTLKMGILPEPIDWDGNQVRIVLLIAADLQHGEDMKQLFREISQLSDHPDRIHRFTVMTNASSIFELL